MTDCIAHAKVRSATQHRIDLRLDVLERDALGATVEAALIEHGVNARTAIGPTKILIAKIGAAI